ncbi:unnamed protein product [Mytilus coruscus]|uniref:Uncharacterized protein n=1 Tax=Mytilus coruscus TaxID=42192 RepID=A0A6J8EU92_MYTCO|nr:unnamed protein product [Mytilus coruscus]
MSLSFFISEFQDSISEQISFDSTDIETRALTETFFLCDLLQYFKTCIKNHCTNEDPDFEKDQKWLRKKIENTFFEIINFHVINRNGYIEKSKGTLLLRKGADLASMLHDRCWQRRTSKREQESSLLDNSIRSDTDSSLSNGYHKVIYFTSASGTKTKQKYSNNIKELKQDFEMFTEKMSKIDDTFKFWHDFVHKHCFSYVALYLSFRSLNWYLRIAALKNMAPLFHALDRHMYLRLIPKHLNDVFTMQIKVLQHLENMGFSATKSGKSWQKLALDEAHESFISIDVKESVRKPSPDLLDTMNFPEVLWSSELYYLLLNKNIVTDTYYQYKTWSHRQQLYFVLYNMASPLENSKENKLQKEEELTLEERAVLLSAFDKLGAKPKTTSTTGLKIWLAQMAEASKQVEELKKAETTKQADTTKQPEIKPNIEILNKLGTTQSIPVTTTNVTSSVTSNPAVMSSGNVQTLTSLPNYTPRISTFFGEPGKGEATYDLWRYEVDSLRKSTFAPHIVDLLIRRSLRGEAEKVAMRLGPEASLDQLLNKLEVNYGLSIQHDKLMEEFYSAKQKPNEYITAWANRLEDLL